MVLERLSRGHFPLYFLLLKGAVAAAGGAGEVSMRLPSVAFYALAVASFWHVATRLLQARAAMLAVTMFALNGLALRQATEARMYTLVLLLSVWIAMAYLSALQGDRRARWRWVFLGATLVSFWTSPTMALSSWVYVAHALWNRRRNPGLLRMVLPPWVLAGLSVLPNVFIHAATAQGGEVALTRPLYFPGHLVSLVVGSPTRDDYYNFTWPLTLLHTAGSVIFAAMMWRLWKARRSLTSTLAFCALAVLLPAAVMVVSWLLNKAFGRPQALMGPARYLMPTLPCAVLLGASLIGDLGARLRQSPAAVQATMALLLGAGAWLLLSLPTEGSRFRYYMGELARSYRPGDGLMVITHQIKQGAEYYAPKARVDLALDRNEMDTQRLADQMKPFADRDRVWLVVYRLKHSPAVQVAASLLGPYQSSSKKGTIGLLRVLRFTPRASLAAPAMDDRNTSAPAATLKGD
jgi:hypothetical protein